MNLMASSYCRSRCARSVSPPKKKTSSRIQISVPWDHPTHSPLIRSASPGIFDVPSECDISKGSHKMDLSPVRGRTMKEYDQHLDELRKENFDLKLRLYFLEEKLDKKFDQDARDVHRNNLQLKVEVGMLQAELAEKNKRIDHLLNFKEECERKFRDRELEFLKEKQELEERVSSLEQQLFSGGWTKEDDGEDRNWTLQGNSTTYSSREAAAAMKEKMQKRDRLLRCLIEKAKEREALIAHLQNVLRKNEAAVDAMDGAIQSALVQATVASRKGDQEGVAKARESLKVAIKEKFHFMNMDEPSDIPSVPEPLPEELLESMRGWQFEATDEEKLVESDASCGDQRKKCASCQAELKTPAEEELADKLSRAVDELNATTKWNEKLRMDVEEMKDAVLKKDVVVAEERDKAEKIRKEAEMYCIELGRMKEALDAVQARCKAVEKELAIREKEMQKKVEEIVVVGKEDGDEDVMTMLDKINRVMREKDAELEETRRKLHAITSKSGQTKTFGQSNNVNQLKEDVCILVLKMEQAEKDFQQKMHTKSKLAESLQAKLTASQKMVSLLLRRLEDLVEFLERLLEYGGGNVSNLCLSGLLSPAGVASFHKYLTESRELSQTMCGESFSHFDQLDLEPSRETDTSLQQQQPENSLHELSQRIDRLMVRWDEELHPMKEKSMMDDVSGNNRSDVELVDEELAVCALQQHWSSESDIWSEPDRDVSQQRIGMRFISPGGARQRKEGSSAPNRKTSPVASRCSVSHSRKSRMDETILKRCLCAVERLNEHLSQQHDLSTRVLDKLEHNAAKKDLSAQDTTLIRQHTETMTALQEVLKQALDHNAALHDMLRDDAIAKERDARIQAEQEAHRLREKLQQRDNETQGLVNVKQQLEREVVEIGTLHAQVHARLKTLVKDNEQLKEALDMKLKDLQMKDDELKSVKNMCKKMEDEKNKEEQERKKMKDECEALKDELKQVKERLKDADAKCERMEKEMGQAHSWNVQLQEQITAIEGERDALKERLRDVEEKENQWREVSNLRDTVNEMQRLNKSLQVEIKVYKQLVKKNQQDENDNDEEKSGEMRITSSPSSQKQQDNVDESLLMELLGEMRHLRTELSRTVHVNKKLQRQLSTAQQQQKVAPVECTSREEGQKVPMWLDKCAEGSVVSSSATTISGSFSYFVGNKGDDNKVVCGDEDVFSSSVSSLLHERVKQCLRDDDELRSFPTVVDDVSSDVSNSVISSSQHHLSPDLGIESDPNRDSCTSALGNAVDEGMWHRLNRLSVQSAPVAGSNGNILALSGGSFECLHASILSPKELEDKLKSSQLQAVADLEDHELLKKEIGECVVVLRGMRARVKERLTSSAMCASSTGGSPVKNLEYATLKELNHSCNVLAMCLEKGWSLVRRFAVVALPRDGSSSTLLRANSKLKKELTVLKGQLTAANKELRDTKDKLKAAESKREGMEKAITKQLDHTRRVLQQARGNLEERQRGTSLRVASKAKTISAAQMQCSTPLAAADGGQQANK